MYILISRLKSLSTFKEKSSSIFKSLKELIRVHRILRNMGFIAAMIAILAVGGYAWWLINAIPVSFCSDTDGGLNFTTVGVINFTFNGTPFLFEDSCASSAVIYEYGCSAQIPEYNHTPGFAVLVGENCTAVLGPNSTCFKGRCVLE